MRLIDAASQSLVVLGSHLIGILRQTNNSLPTMICLVRSWLSWARPVSTSHVELPHVAVAISRESWGRRDSLMQSLGLWASGVEMRMPQRQMEKQAPKADQLSTIPCFA